MQHKYDTRNINQVVDITCTDIFRCFDRNFLSSSPVVQTNKIKNIHSKIRLRIHATGMDPYWQTPDFLHRIYLVYCTFKLKKMKSKFL